MITALTVGYSILISTIMVSLAIFITICIEKRKDELDLACMCTNFSVIILILAGIVLVVFSCYPGLYPSGTSDKTIPYETDTHIIILSEVNNDNIRTETNDIFYLRNIKNFDWTIGTTYEITIGKHYNQQQSVVDIRKIEE